MWLHQGVADRRRVRLAARWPALCNALRKSSPLTFAQERGKFYGWESADRAYGGSDRDDPEHAAARHLEQGKAQARPAAARGGKRGAAAIRCVASAAARGAGKNLRRAILRASARGGCRRPLCAARRLH